MNKKIIHVVNRIAHNLAIALVEGGNCVFREVIVFMEGMIDWATINVGSTDSFWSGFVIACTERVYKRPRNSSEVEKTHYNALRASVSGKYNICLYENMRNVLVGASMAYGSEYVPRMAAMMKDVVKFEGARILRLYPDVKNQSDMAAMRRELDEMDREDA